MEFWRYFQLEVCKARIAPYVKEILHGLGEENLRYMVANNITLWDIWEGKEKILRDALLSEDELKQIGMDGFITVFGEIIAEGNSQYSFITKEWIWNTCRKFKKDLEKSRV